MIKEVMNYIAQADPEIGAAILREYDRQMHNIELIASENIVSGPAMMAMGTVLTNKYAEGYPGKRYYGGCVNVDEIETIAIERAKKLFGCEYANVQPHSGAQANMAVTMAICEPGDTIMGMSLDAGGHLTHGSPANFSGRFYNIVPYGINADGYIDYDEVEALAMKHHPKMIIAGASDSIRRRDDHDDPQDPSWTTWRTDPVQCRGCRTLQVQQECLPRQPGRPTRARHRR